MMRRLRRALAPIVRPALRSVGWQPRSARRPRLGPGDRLEAAVVPTRVSVRADAKLLVNDVPFFPLALYYTRDEMADATGAGLRELRRVGFNTLFYEGGFDSADDLDRIHDAGFYVCFRPTGRLYFDFLGLKDIVLEYGRHPAVLFWEMDDEPVLNGLPIESVRVGCELVHQLDPFHPILCNQWYADAVNSEEMTRWSALADVSSFSAYPVGAAESDRRKLAAGGFDDSVAVVGQLVEAWRTFAPGKPVISVLQAWAVDPIRDGMAGFPSSAESRFMAYHSVVAGASGLHHYGQRATSRPNVACGLPPRVRESLEETHADFLHAQQHNRAFWREYDRLIGELSAMTPVFLAPDVPWGTELEQGISADRDTPLRFRLKRTENGDVLLAVNTGSTPRDLHVSLPTLRDRIVHVWGEHRSIAVGEDGILADVIDPFGVHVYAEAAAPF